jgi:DNA-binding response OmpR family regulator
LRQEYHITAPVVFATSLSTEEGVVAGLSAGADDYMIKPIRQFELLSRLEAVWRRINPPPSHPPQSIELPPFRIDIRQRRIFRSGIPIEGITEKELSLSILLFENLGRLMSREHLLAAVWGLNAGVPTRTLDTHISRVRKKLDLGPESGFRLVPAYNYGYRLERVAFATK